MTEGQGDTMLSERELSEEIMAILRPLAKDGSEITADTDLVDDLSLDSLKIMEVMAEVEDRFDISVPINIVSDIRTVRDVIRQLQKLLAEAD
jgi:acyl carrier protein